MPLLKIFSQHQLGSVFTYLSAPACTNRSISKRRLLPDMLKEDIFLSVIAFLLKEA